MTNNVVDLSHYVATRDLSNERARDRVPESNLALMLQIYCLLHAAMTQNTMTDAVAGHDTAQAMQILGQVIKNDSIASGEALQKIQNQQDEMKTFQTCMIVLGVVGGVAGATSLAIPLVPVLAGSVTAATVGTVAGIVGATATIASGAMGIADGVFTIETGKNEATYADYNGDTSLRNGEIQSFQSLNGWVASDVGNGMGKQSDMAATIAQIIKAFGQGLMAVFKDAAAG
jgi:hypothetical protein